MSVYQMSCLHDMVDRYEISISQMTCNGHFPFYVFIFLPLSLTRLLPDLTIGNMAGVLLEMGTAYTSRAPYLPQHFSFLWFVCFICLCSEPCAQCCQ
jgi:hypothetical protein